MPASIIIGDLSRVRWMQKEILMKSIYSKNTRGKTILYVLLALSVLSFIVLFLIGKLIPENVFLLLLMLDLMCIMLTGGLIIGIRSGPPW